MGGTSIPLFDRVSLVETSCGEGGRHFFSVMGGYVESPCGGGGGALLFLYVM